MMKTAIPLRCQSLKKLVGQSCDSIASHLYEHPGTVKKVYPKHKVRTSASDRTLESMFPKVSQSQVVFATNGNESRVGPRSREIKESVCRLASVQSLRSEVVQAKHPRECLATEADKYSSIFTPDLSEILEQHTFVGVADLQRSLSLIQHGTKLYLVNHGALR